MKRSDAADDGRRIGSDDDPDRELRVRLRAGDQAAFTEAVECYAQRLRGLARRITYDATAAEDLVQEALLKLWTERARLDPEGGSLLPWLRRVTTNLSLNYCERRRVRARPLPERDGAGEPDPADSARTAETRARIEAAVSLLPADRRAVLTLRVFEEMSYEEIAATLSIAPGTVMSRLHRARLELRERLAELDPGGQRDGSGSDDGGAEDSVRGVSAPSADRQREDVA